MTMEDYTERRNAEEDYYPDPDRSWMPWLIAALIVLCLIVVFL